MTKRHSIKHVLITGGAGFIGSHLCDAFLKLGYAVTAIDNLSTGQMKNLTHAIAQPHFHFLKQNVCQPLDLSTLPLISEFGLDGVLHFACPASPVDFDRIPFEILEVDSIGTMHTVALALEYKCRYLLASTSEIYGDPTVHPQTESYWGNVNPIGPRACYDETKRFAEAYVSTAIRQKNLNGGIVRIFNTYGPRMRLHDGRIIPEFCRRSLKKDSLKIHGQGKQTRSFCYIADLVDGIVELFKNKTTAPVNLGNPEERTVLSIAQLVNKMTANSTPFEYVMSRIDDPQRRQPDISRATELLRWSPRVDLESGLKVTLDYFRNEK